VRVALSLLARRLARLSPGAKPKTMTNLTMKKNTITALSAAAALVLSATAYAGPKAAPAPKEVVAPAAETLKVNGTLSFTVDTHFISYGADVWGAGTSWNDPLFHPQLELTFGLTDSLKLIIGTWWDVNDNALTTIGSHIQEVDVWGGLSYTAGAWNFTAIYQEWMYAGESERIVDLKVAYDTFLKPSLTIHGRVDGNGLQKEGIVGVLGLAYDFKAGPVSFSVPLNVAAMTDGFQGGDAGFGYVSAGLTASVPIGIPGTTLNLGATYYHTNDSVIPGNPDSDFVTGSAGISISF
jgi:hypothetical protein